ncbi:sensor histidine kinase [Microbacterium jiangjiandongii]|uniref:sensor histidine kinase n=1 Tax=Microbacterium jiangjiandongii TaxID=3049071 RepID=UPI00214C9924|nr:histidine kinase [Microbacterium sp. zg.Y843]MCR2814617.1 histidine kinase [Microbacterium sp. zg.Y843]
MTRPATPSIDAAARSELRLTRGIRVTWWYTLSAIVFFELVLLTLAISVLADGDATPFVVAVVAGGGLVWCASTVVLLTDYRDRTDTGPLAPWPRTLAPLLTAAAYGAAIVMLTGLWVLAALPLAQALMFLNWQAGVRLRVVLLVTVVLAALWAIDMQETLGDRGFIGIYVVSLPGMTVASLWWWDVLIALDRARASEARLAATQERLRVATDVHDLQGHHLQVIALQLELAERLLARDPQAALEHLQTARTSVDEARQGTRDLATRFRAVPLRDELANAVDLLRAAGIAAEASVDPDADLAPAAVLGPVIRETTTNVLRHGGGGWARLALTRVGSSWLYEITNDRGADVAAAQDGAGLDGLARRAADAGGVLDVRRAPREFAVSMTVPAQVGVLP